MILLHLIAVAAGSFYLLLLAFAGGMFLWFMFPSQAQQRRWNSLNESDPEIDFFDTAGEMRGY